MLSFKCDILEEIVATRKVFNADGVATVEDSGLSPVHLNALYRTVLSYKPAVALEVGMANGTSALAILSALRDVDGGGKLISIDPNQSTDWKNRGVLNVERAGFTSQHTLLEDFDYYALPEMLKQGNILDFAYIDGWHTFDSVLLDFFYIDKMLNPGGIVVFNDAGYRAVFKAINFARTHRKYDEMDVGLKPVYPGRNIIFSLVRRVMGFSAADRYFQKLEQWEPNWDFYARF